MRWLALILALLGTASCGPRWERSDDALLKECWGAVPRPETGAYELHFEALVISATEGGTFARSSACPDHRLWFVQVDSVPQTQLQPIQDAAWGVRALGIGIRGTAVVAPLERRHEHNLGVRILALPHLETMSEAETRQFIRRFNIG